MISDDSGLCISALNNKPGIYSARLAKKHGGFFKAMKYILRKMKKIENRRATFICSLSYKGIDKKIISVEGKIKESISTKILGKKVLDMIQYLFQLIKKLLLGKCQNLKKLKLIIDL